MKDTSLKQYYDTVLQKTDSSGEGKRCPDHTDEITVTQAPEYGSPAERENGNQETLKLWYDTGTGYYVWKRKCELCVKEFYTISNFRKYCHMSDCRNMAKQKRNERRKQEHHSEHICSVCGSTFVSKRIDAMFCSNACRQKAYRQSVTDASK